MSLINYCPNCGDMLVQAIIDKIHVKKCEKCHYIDWDNWVNILCVVVAYNENKEF